MYSKKKAFTLTELLVVVIVLGVLAAVSVPRFSRVLETRKTTEAENILTAVRTEQENRCVFGKDYLSDSSQLSMLSGVNDPNYTYSLGTQGITATSKNKGYQLKMLSYKDGQICCEGAYCDSLNKDYVRCSSLTVGVDECAADSAEEDEPQEHMCSTHGAPTTSRGCNGCGWQDRTITCDTSTGDWIVGEWGECSKTVEECNPVKSCDESTKPVSSESCNGCGTRTRSVTCNTSTGLWVTGSWGECSKTEEECNCKETYGTKSTASASDTDTCDGNQTSQYTCKDGYKGTCQDVYTTQISFTTTSALVSSNAADAFLLADATNCRLSGGTPCGNNCCFNSCCQGDGTCGTCTTPGGDYELLPEDPWPGKPVDPVKPVGPIIQKLYYKRLVTCCGN